KLRRQPADDCFADAVDLAASIDQSAKDTGLLQFYPAEVENLLALIENQNANRKGHKLEEYRTTTFGERAKGKGYDFYVENQEFRQAPR
ncbi:MAG: hypothetical protein ABI614_25400, partial [Planctomycetota bacterium]